MAAGVVVLGPRPATVLQRQQAAVLHAGPSALLAGEAALVQAGLTSWSSSRLDVVARRGVGAMAGATFHRTRDVPVVGAAGPVPAVTVPLAVCQAAAWSRTDEQARTVVRMALQQRLTSARAVDAALRPRTRRASVVREVVDDASGGATTRAEAAVRRAWARRPGLPPLRTQVPFTDRWGRGRLLDDALCPADVPGLTVVVALELEGLGHLDPRTSDDAAKHADAAELGIVVVRVPNHVALADPGAVVDRLLAVARRFGARA